MEQAPRDAVLDPPSQSEAQQHRKAPDEAAAQHTPSFGAHNPSAASTDAIMDAAAATAVPDSPTVVTGERVDDLLIPPLNFGRVCRGVYRSGFPGKKNFTFLKKLKLYTVLNLSEHEYPKETLDFLAENEIEWKHMAMLGNREPIQTTDEALLCKVLVWVLQATASKPLLIHCTKGTHRTGCIVGCLRKLEEWSLTSIFDEYQRYAGNKAPHLDQQFIEFFAPTEQHREMARKRELLDA
eukprot:Tamp_10602.p1 GENE.Tamp_10602~~Tamp_10602.p1  ORF type:complete len:239 (+),score=61.01 Tamp_10602:506-1222(+)